ncbi:spliceosome-associated protein CWC15-like protein [Dinothrombium tinctorium]|uniref:Spliceosome-associated protein CWC15-like protein n=1 Tax=Dinothrombium tinctorium TaxID=1965070 RepID=A0A443QML4_9ACAR|nr:spliceosome-associated protein CWC15-like protein [Dinothrombium tinctorium]
MASFTRSFESTKGGFGKGEKNLGVLSKQYSSRDLPSHLKLKYRQSGQGTAEDLKSKDFRKELQERERVAFQEKESSKRSSQQTSSSRATAALPSSKKPRLETNIDADEPIRDEDDDDTSDSDEDDTEQLLAELNRIKRERAQEEARKEAERKAQEEKIRMENILSGNPLLNSNKSDFKVKRRWDDDVVFKNCAKNDFDEKEKPFINDTLRSQFHRKFMEKYIK